MRNKSAGFKMLFHYSRNILTFGQNGTSSRHKDDIGSRTLDILQVFSYSGLDNTTCSVALDGTSHLFAGGDAVADNATTVEDDISDQQRVYLAATPAVKASEILIKIKLFGFHGHPSVPLFLK